VDDGARDYPWVGTTDERFTLALVLDVGEVLVRHGYGGADGGHAGRADRRALPRPSRTYPATGCLRLTDLVGGPTSRRPYPAPPRAPVSPPLPDSFNTPRYLRYANHRAGTETR
jgi:hypothetical protein